MTENLITLDDVIGHANVKDALLERLDLYINHKDIYKKANARPPSGLLLYGAPGTGKTMIIKACYNSIIRNNKNFVYKELNMSEISAGNKTGAAHKKIISFFDIVRESKKDWIIIFDELDAICPNRYKTSAVCTVERINALLSCLDGTNGTLENAFIIGTTNRYAMIDDAIKRSGRFDDSIEVGYPNLYESILLAQKYLSGLELEQDLKTASSALGNFGFSASWVGADYDNLKTKLVGVFIKNKLMPLSQKDISGAVLKIGIKQKRDWETGQFIKNKTQI